MPAIDISGQKFHRLTALKTVGTGSRGIMWLCQCDCGNETTASTCCLRGGHTKSCGCLQKEKASKNSVLARRVKAEKTPPLEVRFWSKVDRRGVDECWPWTAGVRRKDEGYGAFAFNGQHQPASRVSWILAFGSIDGNLEVCHRCDNPSCCNPNHLFLGTRKDNNDDKVAKRRHAFGERVNTAKLTEAQVLEIKRAKPVGRTKPGYRTAIAKIYGVSPCTITDIWGRRWAHLNQMVEAAA
jgi:hypothetical protein